MSKNVKKNRYLDSCDFKGNTFEKNIGRINNLYFGQSMQISDRQFIIGNEKDRKNYIQAYSFELKDSSEVCKQVLYYPPTYLNLVFSCKELLFNYTDFNNLAVYEFKKNKFYKFIFSANKEKKPNNYQEPKIKEQQKENNQEKIKPKNNKDDIAQEQKQEQEQNLQEKQLETSNELKIQNQQQVQEQDKQKKLQENNNQSNIQEQKQENTQGKNININQQKNRNNQSQKDNKGRMYITKKVIDINENKVSQILEWLEHISKNPNRLNENYETLCDIFELLGEKLNDKPKKFTGEIIFEIKTDSMDSHLKGYVGFKSYEIDGVGKINEPIKLVNDKINMKNGIDSLIKYIEKQEKKEDIKDLIDNDFKTVIIYKNFVDEYIPKNKTMIVEIKSGFSLDDVKNQINERINFIKNCLFVENERPSYFVGIINVLSKNKDNLRSLLNYEFNLSDENILIAATVNYQYCGHDASCEIHIEYLLLKEMRNMKNEMRDMKNEMRDMKNEIKNNCEEIKNIKDSIDENTNVLNNINDSIRALLNIIKINNPSMSEQIDQIILSMRYNK